MNDGDHLIIAGASTRAAAFSALRAGFKPWCIDLFADADLRAKCPVMRIPREEYPNMLPEYVERYAPKGPWMYTGGLENHPRVIAMISEMRQLWGMWPRTLRWVRNLSNLSRFGIRVPETRTRADNLAEDGTWLIKPLNGCGGHGIRRWTGLRQKTPNADFYFRKRRLVFQEFIEGPSYSALYFGTHKDVGLLEVTRQLVGERWLHAAPFSYCGTVGPTEVSSKTRTELEAIGKCLPAFFKLHGLFGLDCILHGDRPWVIEVNPRYTASVEVVELARKVPLLYLYPCIFPIHRHRTRQQADENFIAPFPVRKRTECRIRIGKAILFAKDNLTFPADGPWSDVLRHPPDVRDMPPYADIPVVGTPIEKGHPILTFFAGATSEEACLEELQRIAAELDRWLYKG